MRRSIPGATIGTLLSFSKKPRQLSSCTGVDLFQTTRRIGGGVGLNV